MQQEMSVAQELLKAATQLADIATNLVKLIHEKEKPKPTKPTRVHVKKTREQEPVVFSRNGELLVRVRQNVNGKAVHRHECEWKHALLLIEEMIKQGGMAKNVKTHNILKDLPAANRTVITDWLNHSGMIRRMRGAYRLRNCDPHTYKEVIEERFQSLPTNGG